MNKDALTDTAKRHIGSGRAALIVSSGRLIVLSLLLILRAGSSSSSLLPIALLILATFLIDLALVIRNHRILGRIRHAQANSQPITIPAQLPYWVAMAYRPELAVEHPRLQTNGAAALGSLVINGNQYTFLPTKQSGHMGVPELSWTIDPASALYVRAPFTKYQGVVHFTDAAHAGQVVELYTRCFNPKWLQG